MSHQNSKNARSRIEKKANELSDELMELIANPRAVEILSEMWLYDETLKPPSDDLILLLTGAILRDSDLMRELENAEDEQEGFRIFAKKLATTGQQKVKFLALEQAKRQIEHSLFHPKDSEGTRAAIWFPLVDMFRQAESSIGRLVVQKSINMILARALWNLDFKMIESLAAVTKELRTLSFEKNRASRSIAADVLYWEPYLESKLGYSPTKSALKSFILGVNTEQASRDADWSKAHKILGNETGGDRMGKRTPEELLAKLALEARRLS